jgi:hypothetical protein
VAFARGRSQSRRRDLHLRIIRLGRHHGPERNPIDPSRDGRPRQRRHAEAIAGIGEV